MKNKVKMDMGLEQESNDIIAFDEYLDTLSRYDPDSKAAQILENT